LPSFYVYYRVSEPDSAAARACAEAVVADVRDATGVAGRLLRRCDDPGTWMEIYENVPAAAAFERILARAAESRGLGRHLAAGAARVVERFESL
jgi:hypothetical protein